MGPHRPARPAGAYVAGRDGTGRRAVVVGAGYGADAEHLAALGYETTAFDISPAAVAAARERYPDSAVDYRVADLLDLPDDLVGAFDLVVEIYTIQALHGSLRERRGRPAYAGWSRRAAPCSSSRSSARTTRRSAPSRRGCWTAPRWRRSRATGWSPSRWTGCRTRPSPRLRDRWRMVLSRR